MFELPQRSKNVLLVAMMATAVASLSGCAFANVEIEPPAKAAPNIATTQGRGREIALVAAFDDRRPERQRCGMQKNSYNMDTADVECTMPPSKWMSEALARGLTAAGYVVTAAPSPSPTAARVDGEVLQFFVEPKIEFFRGRYEADISMKLRITTPAGLSAERTFYFKEREVPEVFENNFQLAATASTDQAVERMVAAITALLDRYPSAAAPTVSAVSMNTEVRHASR